MNLFSEVNFVNFVHRSFRLSLGMECLAADTLEGCRRFFLRKKLLNDVGVYHPTVGLPVARNEVVVFVEATCR